MPGFHHRSGAAQPTPKGAGREPEVVRVWLLGGFRVSVGRAPSRRARGG